jgi:hypothetical protein
MMNFSRRTWWIVLSGGVIGLLADYISVLDGYPEDIFLGFWIGFTLLIPLALLFLILLVRATHLRNRLLIILNSVVMFLAVMFFAFWLYDLRHGPGQISDMYGAIYVFGSVPALIIGIIYGALLPAAQRNREIGG